MQRSNAEEFDPLQNMQVTSDHSHNNDSTSKNFQYKRSRSMDDGNYQQRSPNIQKCKSIPGDHHNDGQRCKDSENNSFKNNTDKVDEFEKQISECNDHSPVQYEKPFYFLENQSILSIASFAIETFRFLF
jgi:hypothetical protein